MSWMNEISGLLQQYAGGAALAPDEVHDHFDQVAQAAPQSALISGLTSAFNSSSTPPFENMVGQLFANGNGQQRAGLLNTLLATAGPALLSQAMSRGGGGGGGLAGLLGALGGGGSVTPEQAQQIDPDDVQQLAAAAAQHDPSVVERVSGFYAAHPTLVKTLGAAALSLIMAKVAQHGQGG
jgi:hypothetical protein